VIDLRKHAEVLAIFELCYEVVAEDGLPRLRRTVLPVTGGAEDQPHRTMQELTLIERVESEELAEDLKERRKQRNG